MERFWTKVDKTNGPMCERLGTRCWPWRAGCDGGYGRFHFNGQKQLAHRVAWVLTYGTLPEWTGDMGTTTVVCHECDFPACCNPEHLKIGLQRDNQKDKKLRGRARGAKFEFQNPNTKLSDEQISSLLLMKSQGYTQKEIAGVFGVSQPHVSDIVNGKKRHTKPR